MSEAVQDATIGRKAVEKWIAVFDGSAELSEGLFALHMVLNNEEGLEHPEAHLNALRWMVKALRRDAEDHHQRVVDIAPRGRVDGPV